MTEIETITIGLLAYPAAQRSALFGLADLFDTADRLHCSSSPSSVRRKLNIEIINQLSTPGTTLSVLILPPCLSGIPTLENEDDGKALVNLHATGVLVCSVCAGAFLLAETGLLKGREMTTHWALADEFRARFPDPLLNTDKLIIDDGDIITAGGVMAWIDVGLKLVDRYLGNNTMLETARFLLVNPGGREQRFYSTFLPTLSHGDEQILGVQHWIQRHYAEPIFVPDLAKQANMTKRTFIRRFQQATGLSPSEYLRHVRVGQARSKMETTKRSVDQIAWDVGYSDTTAFRRVFQKLIGLTPREYRSRFSPNAATSSK